MNKLPDNSLQKTPEGKITGSPLRGQHAVVTGATRGIGASIAETFGRLGADLTLIGRDRNGLIKRADDISNATSVSVHIEPADIIDMNNVGKAFATILAANGPISILVNNAGLGKSAPFHSMGEDLWNNMISVNLNGTFYCTREVIGGMLEAGYGRIINLASTAGLIGYEYVSAYCAAKHGVIGLTRSLALETATRGITVNAVCPGYTETDLLHETIDNIVTKTGRSIEETRMELAASNPQKRLVQPWEVAETVAWLALPSSASITGQAISVAGGEVM